MTDHLIAPHGGTLVDLIVSESRAAELKAASERSALPAEASAGGRGPGWRGSGRGRDGYHCDRTTNTAETGSNSRGKYTFVTRMALLVRAFTEKRSEERATKLAAIQEGGLRMLEASSVSRSATRQ